MAKGAISQGSCNAVTNGFTLAQSYVLAPDGEELTMEDGSGSWQRTNVYGIAHQAPNAIEATAGATPLHLTSKERDFDQGCHFSPIGLCLQLVSRTDCSVG